MYDILLKRVKWQCIEKRDFQGIFALTLAKHVKGHVYAFHCVVKV